ncbi:thioredoxin domain-containing protein [Marinifilum fragile]|uniref:thioredoxin domain-containing protein n=1 Tax=Marinifilum fragile TaxID=570161 RepID=UPI002AAAADAC|nr:thioredoxin domain-containing protein [Marinifilum fragile]
MKNLKYWYAFSYLLIAIGIILSFYLLNTHFNMTAGKFGESDLCTVVFGKSCKTALYSSYATFAKIPIAGWGAIYFISLALFLGLGIWLSSSLKKTMLITAFWICAVSLFASLFFIYKMLVYPILFCPFCFVIHISNLLLFFFLKKLTETRFSDLFKALKQMLALVILGKKESLSFKNWHALPYIIAICLVLVMYQWIRIQGLSINMNKLASYDPLEELLKFDSIPAANISEWSGEPILGPVDAPVSMVVYSDFQCSMCAMFGKSFTELIKCNEGRLNIRYKYFPLSSSCNPIAKYDMHPNACEAARAAQAAHQQGMFWSYHDSLFNQNLNDVEPDVFIHIANSLKLNLEQFNHEFNSETCQQKIAGDIQEGVNLKLDGTPSVFLNGKRIYDLRPQNINFLIKYLSNNLNKTDAISIQDSIYLTEKFSGDD